MPTKNCSGACVCGVIMILSGFCDMGCALLHYQIIQTGVTNVGSPGISTLVPGRQKDRSAGTPFELVDGPKILSSWLVEHVLLAFHVNLLRTVDIDRTIF